MTKSSFSLFEFQQRYRTEQDCLRTIEKVRWPHGFICPKCEHHDGYRLHTRRVIECVVCKYQSSITAGTVFHKTKISLLKWFWAIYLIAQDKGGISALRLSKQLDINFKTAWRILHKIRRAMSRHDARTTYLSGVIELDEAFFGGKQRKTQVLVAIEKESNGAGHLVMKKIFGRGTSKPAIKRVVKAYVNNETKQHFVTDCAGAHSILVKMGHRLETYKSTPASATKHLPLVHLAISLAKTFLLGTYHGVSKKYLQRYLDEFCYRFNRRLKESTIYQNLIRTCVLIPPRFGYLH